LPFQTFGTIWLVGALKAPPPGHSLSDFFSPCKPTLTVFAFTSPPAEWPEPFYFSSIIRVCCPSSSSPSFFGSGPSLRSGLAEVVLSFFMSFPAFIRPSADGRWCSEANDCPSVPPSALFPDRLFYGALREGELVPFSFFGFFLVCPLFAGLGCPLSC